MRFQRKNPSGFIRPAILLAVVLPIMLAEPVVAQAKPVVKPKSDPVTLVIGLTNVDVIGPEWKLRYGSPTNAGSTADPVRARLAVAENGTAWFSHGGWLRLIDVRKGVVLGRWHFTDVIVGLVTKGDAVEVEYRMDSGTRTSAIIKKAIVSPQTQKIDFVNPYNLAYTNVSRVEAGRVGEFAFLVTPPDGTRLAGRARKLIPEYEEMARRDPTSPFIQAAYGALLKEVGDPRAGRVLREATEVESSDFTELWTLSSYLESIDEPALGKAAFERGYRDFLERGNDPRMFTVLIGRLIHYRTLRREGSGPPAARKDYLEREYRMGPNMEASYLAWAYFARELQAQGDPAAIVWRERAKQSAKEDFISWPVVRLDGALLVYFGGLFGSIIFVFVQLRRYAPQRRLDAAKGVGGNFLARILRAFSYWSRRERYQLAAMVAISWYCLGLMAVLSTGFLRVASTPLNMLTGTLATPQGQAFLEKLPETSGRNFMIALAHQQAGDADKALPIYLGQPQFAQAWNNLGVIYREKGEEAKAKEAFAKALQVDSGLNEAKLNLGQPTTDIWTTQYRSYFPGKAMMAPASGEQIREAYLGTSGVGIFVRSLAGPLLGRPGDQLAVFSNEASLPLPALWTTGVLLAIALLLVFILPYREVTEAPPRWLHWLELLLPGTSRTWGWFGGIALASWGTALFALLCVVLVGAPLFATAVWMPNVARAYNVVAPASEFGIRVGRLLTVAAPARDIAMVLGNWVYLWLIPAAFFVLNLVFFVRERKRGAR